MDSSPLDPLSAGVGGTGGAGDAAPGASAVPTRTRGRVRMMGKMIFLLLLMATLLAIASHKVQFQKVISGSMEPNLLIGDEVLVDANEFPRRYDIICLKDPEFPTDTLVKRVIGLPGDKIVIQDGILYINGKEEYSEHVASNMLESQNMHIVVPDETLFVMGDNRNNSVDSRVYGPVPFANITGTVRCIVLPLSRAGHTQPLHDGDPESQS